MISSKNTRIFPWCCKCTVQVRKAWWFGDVHASVAKCRHPECSYAEIEWTIHKSNPMTYLQNIVNPLTRYIICGHYIPRDCPWARKRCSRSPSFHNNFEMILDYFMWAIIFGTHISQYGLWSSNFISYCKKKEYDWSTHLTSSAVWAWCDILMGFWPWWANTANINPSRPSDYLFLNADSTRSWPKHLSTWLLRLDVAVWSFESR